MLESSTVPMSFADDQPPLLKVCRAFLHFVSWHSKSDTIGSHRCLVACDGGPSTECQMPYRCDRTIVQSLLSSYEWCWRWLPFCTFLSHPSFLLELGGKKTKNLDVLQLFGFIRSLHGMRVLQLYDVMRDGGVYCDGSETWQVVPQQCPVSLYKRN